MRKLAILAPVLLTLMGTSVAYGQNFPSLPTFKHIIIIIQENRTPDNLFGQGAPGYIATCGSEGNEGFEPGVDIDNGGPSNYDLNNNPSTICSEKLTNGSNYNGSSYPPVTCSPQSARK
jgi:phospholipase C